jgi:hypothetical protein
VAGPGVVGVSVADNGPCNRARWVDVKAARGAAKPGRVGRKSSYGRAIGAHASGPVVVIVPDMGTTVTIVSSQPLVPLQAVAFASPLGSPRYGQFASASRNLRLSRRGRARSAGGGCQECSVHVAVDKLQMPMEPGLRFNVSLRS